MNGNNNYDRVYGLMSWLISRGPLDLIVMAATSVAILSPFGWKKILYIGDFYIFEPAIFIIITIEYMHNSQFRKFLSFILTRKGVWGWISICFLLFLIGGLGIGSFSSAYSDFRVVVIIGIVIQAFRSSSSNELNNIIPTIFWLLTFSLCLHYAYYIIFPEIDSEIAKAAYPSMAILFISYVSLRERNFIAFLISLCLASIIAVTSFYRANFMILAIVIVSAIVVSFGQILSSFIKRDSSFIIYIVSYLCIIGLVVIVFPGIAAFALDYMTATESRSVQSVEKFDNIINAINGGGVGDGDDLRIMYISHIINNFFPFLFPSGFGHKELINNWGALLGGGRLQFLGANSMDGGHLFLIMHFGVFISIFFVYYIGVYFHYNSKRVRSFSNKTIRLLMLFGVAFYFTISGIIFVQTAAAFSFAAILAVLISRNEPTMWRGC